MSGFFDIDQYSFLEIPEHMIILSLTTPLGNNFLPGAWEQHRLWVQDVVDLPESSPTMNDMDCNLSGVFEMVFNKSIGLIM